MNIGTLQAAVRHIEAFGVEGLQSAARTIGMPGALALLIAHLRRQHDPTAALLADATIDGRVHDFLVQEVPAAQKFFVRNAAFFYTYEWGCLDNFSAFAVEWRGRLWPTAEHAYQSAKFEAEQMIERIHATRSAHDAKRIANDPEYRPLIRPDWQAVKRDVMEEVLRAKFAQHEYVRKKLRETRGWLLVEDSHRDAYWGRGADWTGENWLGRIWMQIRDEHFPLFGY